MKKLMILLATVCLLASLGIVAGCGGGEEEATADKAQSEATTVATHDCDGACGMKAMTAEQTTEIDGKFYCQGCAKKAKEHDHEGHEGHSH